MKITYKKEHTPEWEDGKWIDDIYTWDVFDNPIVLQRWVPSMNPYSPVYKFKIKPEEPHEN